MNTKNVAIIAAVIVVVAVLAVGITVYEGNDNNGEITFTDTNGDTITLDSECERIVVYSKYIAEAMIMMGCSDLVIGTTTTVKNDINYTDYYKYATALSSSTTEGMDIVLSLEPDLIIAHNTNDTTQLRNTGIPVVELGASKISEIENDITSLGIITGHQTEANKIVDWFLSKMSIINGFNGTSPSFALESYSATRLSFCNPSSTPGVLLESIKGKNVFESTSTTYTYPEGSVLIELNPDVLLVVTYNANWNDAALNSYLDTIYSRAGWNNITAIQNDDVYMISNDIIGGMRSVIGGLFMISLMDPVNNGDISVSELVDEYNSIGNTKFNNQMVYSR